MPNMTQTSHWALYVNYIDEDKHFLYHVTRANGTFISSKLICVEIKNNVNIGDNPECLLSRDKFEKEYPTKILVGYGAPLFTKEKMFQIFNEFSLERELKGEGYNPIYNNCQDTVKQLLNKLVDTKLISQHCIDQLESEKEIVSLKHFLGLTSCTYL